MNEKYEMKINAFKAMSDVNRMMILDMLSCGELCACEILEKLKITQPTLSYHMKILCDARLVKCRKDGKMMMYSMNTEYTQDVIEFTHNILSPTDNCICK